MKVTTVPAGQKARHSRTVVISALHSANDSANNNNICPHSDRGGFTATLPGSAAAVNQRTQRARSNLPHANVSQVVRTSRRHW